MNNFKGRPPLKKFYDQYISNINDVYENGMTICLAGSHGVGKTMTATNILKYIVQKNYTGMYSTLEDIVNVILDAPREDKFFAKKELCITDFLIIDEFDNRFFNSENSAELFGKTFEYIFRNRLQNKLPTIICTNSPNVLESFNGAIKQSIESLFNSVKTVAVIDEDFRRKM